MDVIQQAREALAQSGGIIYTAAEYAWYKALQAVVEAADAGYLIDTRRIEALADEHGLAALVNEDPGQTGSDTSDDCAWVVEYGLMGLRGRRETPWCATAADALAAAEREAQ